MKKKILLALLATVCALCCACGLVACGGGGGGGGGEPQTVAVVKVELNKTAITLEIDGTETLTATVSPDNATDKAVSWSSSAPAVATVDNNGKVTAKAEGSATITAKTSNNKSATCAVTVNAAEVAPVTEVTAVEWTKALTDAKRFTYVQKDKDYTSTHKIDGDKLETTDSDGDHEILVKDGETYYSYVEFDGSWVRRTYTAEQAEEYQIDEWLTGEQRLLLACKDDFGSFTYADGKYTAATLDKTQTMGGTLKNVVAKFNDGKLVEVTFDYYQADGDGGKIEFELKNVGTTTVTVPANYTDYDPDKDYKVTEAEWDQIMDGTDNFTLTMTLISDGSMGAVEKYDGKVKYKQDSDGSRAFYFDGCEYWYSPIHNVTDDVWELRIGELYNPYDISFLSNIFKGGYNSYIYHGGKYTAEEVTYMDTGYPVTIKDVEIYFYDGELQCASFKSYGFEVRIDNIGNTSFEVPALCPVENHDTITVPVGTKVKELYETYPALSTVLGKWKLYMQMGGTWYELGDEQEMPQGSYSCKLVYEGEAEEQPADVEFTLVGSSS